MLTYLAKKDFCSCGFRAFCACSDSRRSMKAAVSGLQGTGRGAGHPQIQKQQEGQGGSLCPLTPLLPLSCHHHAPKPPCQSPVTPSRAPPGTPIPHSPRGWQRRLQQHRRVEQLQVHVFDLSAPAAPGLCHHGHAHHVARHVHVQGQLVREVRLHQGALEGQGWGQWGPPTRPHLRPPPGQPPPPTARRGQEGKKVSPQGRRRTRSCPHQHLQGSPGAEGRGPGTGHSQLPRPAGAEAGAEKRRVPVSPLGRRP